MRSGIEKHESPHPDIRGGGFFWFDSLLPIHEARSNPTLEIMASMEKGQATSRRPRMKNGKCPEFIKIYFVATHIGT
jgi:hypothetical protein